jgi:MFS family permease
MHCHLWAYSLVTVSVAVLMMVVLYNTMVPIAGWLGDRVEATDDVAEKINQSICDYRNLASSGVWLSLAVLVLGFVFYMVCFFAHYRKM